MAIPTNAQTTYSTIGNREDLSDIIYKISPTKTPFMSGIAKVNADNTLHEWQTQELAAAANNAAIEGDDATAIAVTPTTRLNNRAQISTKTIALSGTQIDGMNPAGRKNELSYQITLKGEEIKRDMEVALTQNTVTVTGNATTARQLRGLEGWIKTNNSLGAGGAAPDYLTNTAPTDGTARAFTEAQLKSVLQLCYNEGGDPDMVMVSGSNKQTFSTFTGNSTRFDKGEDKSLTASVDVYVSDFGTLKVIPNRFQRSRTAFVLQTDMWALATQRKLFIKELGVTGDSEKRELIVEYTLEARQEKSSGAVRDLT
jgi:hypothetical protein